MLGLPVGEGFADDFAEDIGEDRTRLMLLLARVVVLLVDPGVPCSAAVGNAGSGTAARGVAPVGSCAGLAMAVSAARGATSVGS